MAAIIFDFDGTIADSFDVIVDIFEHITKRPEKLTEEQMLELRGYPLEIVAERLHIRWWRIPFLLARGRRMMARRMHEIPVFEGMGKVIEELHAEGHELFVVSSNSKRNVRKFLKAHHMYNHFVDIRGNAGLLGKSRDVVSAKAIGMPVVAVSWGFASTDFLKSLHPTALAYEPQEIVRILGEI
jgi:phosphoglycolate phosphatase-like HAD superfamily hydrolase